MAGSSQPGPTCQHNNPAVVNDGTLCRAESPAPGSVSADWEDYFSAAGNWITSEYKTAKSELEVTYTELSDSIQSDYQGGRCLYQASQQAEDLVLAAILTETGYELRSLVQGLIPGLIQMIVIVAATTLLGAAIGGIVGFFFGGVGAAPGAVVGGELGMDAGVAILTWLGVAFLAVAIVKGFGEMMEALGNGVEWAWAARKLDGPAQEQQVTRAAKELARSVGILMRLILQAIVAYLLKKAAVGATRSAISTARAVQNEGAAAVSEATVAELVGKLRASRFGRGFADWVEKNWRNLVKDPKLQEVKPVPTVTAAEGTGAAASDAAGGKPSTSPKPKPTSEPPDEPTGPKKPVASDLENSKFNGVEADRVRPGTSDKVAVIGRSMDQAVNPYADGLREAGYNTETFEPSSNAQQQWSDLRQGYPDGRIPADKIPDTLMFQENQAWAQKLANQGYTVVDVDNPGGAKPSPFYEMEKQTLFGNSGGGN